MNKTQNNSVWQRIQMHDFKDIMDEAWNKNIYRKKYNLDKNIKEDEVKEDDFTIDVNKLNKLKEQKMKRRT
jgi:hypothetical protein